MNGTPRAHNRSNISDSNTAPTLGLEKHVSSVFSQTMTTITNLGNDVERLNKINENLKEKLNDLVRQKETLINKNLKLEQEVEEVKAQNEKLIDQRNRAKVYLGELKKQIDIINDEWEGRKKVLEQEINELNEIREVVSEEKVREEVAAEQQKRLLRKQVDSLKAEIASTKSEIGRFKNSITFLQKKEHTSMDFIAHETLKFKDFIDKVNNGNNNF